MEANLVWLKQVVEYDRSDVSITRSLSSSYHPQISFQQLKPSSSLVQFFQYVLHIVVLVVPVLCNVFDCIEILILYVPSSKWLTADSNDVTLLLMTDLFSSSSAST